MAAVDAETGQRLRQRLVDIGLAEDEIKWPAIKILSGNAVDYVLRAVVEGTQGTYEDVLNY